MTRETVQLAASPRRAVTAQDSRLESYYTEIAEGAAERERESRGPFGAIDLARELRLGALRIPAHEGGGGASLRDFFSVLIALTEADANVAYILRSHFSFIEQRLRSPDHAERARWLPVAVNGLILSEAATELGSVDNGAAHYATKLVRDADGLELHGKKYYCTGTVYSDLVVVLAQMSDGEILNAVVPTDRDGVTISDDWDGMGQRLTGAGTATFTAVRVQQDEVVSEPAHNGSPTSGQAFGQLYLTAIIAGILRSVTTDAGALVRGRQRGYTHGSGDTPVGDPLVQEVVGQIASIEFVAEAAVLRAAEAQDAAYDAVVAGQPDEALELAASLASAKAKVTVDEIALRAATLLFDAGGASATKRSANLDRHWRNIRTLSSNSPTVYKAHAVGDHAINGTFADVPRPPVKAESAELQALLVEIGSDAAERQRLNLRPDAAMALVRAARLGALRVPVANGGAGASRRELFEVLIALARADSDVAHILRSHYGFVERRLLSPAGEERERWLDEIARGAIFGNASTELGTKPADSPTFATTLVPDGSRFRLDGTKYYSTGCLFSDWVSVVAQTPTGEVVSAVVPVDRLGVTLEDDWDGIGQRQTGSGTTRFTGVRVEADEVLREATPAGVYPRQGLQQLYLTALIAGILQSAVDDGVSLVRRSDGSGTHEADSNGRPDPLMQQIVGEMASAAFVAEAAVLRAADTLDQEVESAVDGHPAQQVADEASAQAAKAKIVVDRLALRASERIFDLSGISATAGALNLDRHWRNIRTIASHNPASYKSRALGAQVITGEPLPPNWFI